MQKNQAEQHDDGTIDEVLRDEDVGEGRGDPQSEQERSASWLRFLRRARVAIWRLRRNLWHLPRGALLRMLRAARSRKDQLNAAKTSRCWRCDTKPRPEKHKVSRRPYTFYHEVGVDVSEIVDSVGPRFSILNAVYKESHTIKHGL